MLVLCFVFVARPAMLFNAGERVFAEPLLGKEPTRPAKTLARSASYGKQFSSLFEMLSTRKKLISPRPREPLTVFAGTRSHAKRGVSGWMV